MSCKDINVGFCETIFFRKALPLFSFIYKNNHSVKNLLLRFRGKPTTVPSNPNSLGHTRHCNFWLHLKITTICSSKDLTRLREELKMLQCSPMTCNCFSFFRSRNE